MNCNDYESVIKITENSTIKETGECIVQSSTCPITEGYKAATAQYTVWFNGIRIFKAKQNLCNQHKGPMELAKLFHTIFSLQTNCPVEKVSKKFTVVINQAIVFTYSLKITSCLKPIELNATATKKYIKMFLGSPLKLKVNIIHENQVRKLIYDKFLKLNEYFNRDRAVS